MLSWFPGFGKWASFFKQRKILGYLKLFWNRAPNCPPLSNGQSESYDASDLESAPISQRLEYKIPNGLELGIIRRVSLSEKFGQTFIIQFSELHTSFRKFGKSWFFGRTELSKLDFQINLVVMLTYSKINFDRDPSSILDQDQVTFRRSKVWKFSRNFDPKTQPIGKNYRTNYELDYRTLG